MAVLDWPLLTGVIPLLIGAAGVGSLAVLLAARRDRRWWLRRVPLVLVAALAGVATAATAVELAHPFSDPLPGLVWWPLGASLTGGRFGRDGVWAGGAATSGAGLCRVPRGAPRGR